MCFLLPGERKGVKMLIGRKTNCKIQHTHTLLRECHGTGTWQGKEADVRKRRDFCMVFHGVHPFICLVC